MVDTSVKVSWSSAMVVGPMMGGLIISKRNIRAAPFILCPIVSFSVGIISLVFVKEPIGSDQKADKITLGTEASTADTR